MFSKKYIATAGAVAVLATSVFSIASAELKVTPVQTQPQLLSPKVVTITDQQMVLEIGPRGSALIRGSVSAVNANSLTIKTWGGDWTANVTSSTKFLTGTDLTQVQVGDFVGAQGMANQSNLSIEATVVKNWMPVRKRLGIPEDRPVKVEGQGKTTGVPGVQDQINAILEQIKKIQAQMGTQQ